MNLLKDDSSLGFQKNGNTLEKFSRHLAKIYYDMSMQIIIANERTNLQHDIMLKSSRKASI